MIHLDYRDARPIYTQIVDGFRDQILSGILRQEDKLPSVRELASSLTINPNTIQRAYRQLEMEGWIATVPGKGCFVCGAPTAALRERDALLSEFDKTAAALLALGLTREELAARLMRGGNDHA
jgi:GntR family transcriptional regulator